MDASEDAKVKEQRGDVLQRAINMETIISALISIQYAKSVDEPFMFEVLYDAGFSLGLKVNILEKFAPSEFLPHMQALRRLVAIRNVFAHAGVQFHSFIEGRGGFVDAKKKGKFLDFDALHAEYIAKDKAVNEPLVKWLESSGATFLAG